MSQTFMFRDEMGRQRAANLVANLPLDKCAAVDLSKQGSGE